MEKTEKTTNFTVDTVKNNNVTVIKGILYDIVYMIEGLSYEHCKATENNDLMKLYEELVYEVHCKIKEINTDETL